MKIIFRSFSMIFYAVLIVVLPLRAFPQSVTLNGVKDCQASDLDTSFQFRNMSFGNQGMDVDYRNISSKSCFLEGGIGASFGSMTHGHGISTKDCRNCSTDGNRQPSTHFLLEHGKVARLSLHWKSIGDPGECQDADSINTIVNQDQQATQQAIVPSLISHVCSVVESDSYLDAPGVPVQSLLSPLKIELKASQSVLYAGDTSSIFVTIDDPRKTIQLDGRHCPVAFLRTRSANGATVFIETNQMAKCTEQTSRIGADRKIEMEIQAEGTSSLDHIGINQLQLGVVRGEPHADFVDIAESNAVVVELADPMNAPRVWGSVVDGLRVSLALDKSEYAQDEDVPLRLAKENVSALRAIKDGLFSACRGDITIEVRNASGIVVGKSDQNGEFCVYMGHGQQYSYESSVVDPTLGMSLARLKILPRKAGRYSVIATWHARAVEGGLPDRHGFLPLEPYALVESASTSFQVK